MVSERYLKFLGYKFNFLIAGTYRDRISYNGHVLNDHMLLGSVVATILVLDNTAQVS